MQEFYRLISEELERADKLEKMKLDYLAGRILAGVQTMLGRG